MMVFWEWKVSLKLQINLYRIDIFTTLYFSTQEHGVCVCVCVCITPQFCVYIHTHTPCSYTPQFAQVHIFAFQELFFSSHRFCRFFVKLMSKYFFKFWYYKCGLLCCYFLLTYFLYL